MSDAVNIVLYIFNKFIDFLFNQAYILQGVSIGWILVICSIFTILITAILNRPVGLIKTNERIKGSEKNG